MQEMITNVLKHGRGHGGVTIDYVWADDLRIQVRNYVGDDRPMAGSCSGIQGMRTRLESVGGSLDVVRCGSDEGEIVSATALVPFGATA